MTKRTFLFLIPVFAMALFGVWSAFRSTSNQEVPPVAPSASQAEAPSAASTEEKPVAVFDGNVELQPDRIICGGADGKKQELLKNDMTKVSFLISGAGTKKEENRWMLVAQSGVCEFSSITPGAEDLITWFEALPDFSYRSAIDAMSSKADGEVTVWGK